MDDPPEQINSAPRGHRHRLPRNYRIQNWCIGAALLVEFVALIGHPLFGWFTKSFAQSPAPLSYIPPTPPTAGQLLQALSVRAAAVPESVSTAGLPYAHVRFESWSLISAAAKTTSTGPRPTIVDSWLRSDGSGRIDRRTRDGKLISSTSPTATGALPDLQGQMTGLTRIAAQPSGFQALVYLAEQQPIPGQAEALALRRLAQASTMTNRGSVTDRAGRAGVAVSTPVRTGGVSVDFILIFDPNTGMLLDVEQELLADSSRLHARAGSVVSYTVFLEAGRSRQLSAAAP